MSVVNKVPMRKCVGCGEMKPKRELVRVIRCDDSILVDITGKKNGRGAYICKSADCLERAKKNKGLERSLKESISEEIFMQLKKELDSNG